MNKHRIGIDLGGIKIEIVVLGPSGDEVMRHRVATPQGYQETLHAIANLVQEAEARIGITGTVGIGIPGVISPATGLVKNANSIALNGHRFDYDVSQALGRDVRVENDANCFALSEASDGAAAGFGMRLWGDPGDRLWRWYRHQRQGPPWSPSRCRRVGAYPAALANRRRSARQSLLVRQAWMSGNLCRRTIPCPGL